MKTYNIHHSFEETNEHGDHILKRQIDVYENGELVDSFVLTGAEAAFPAANASYPRCAVCGQRHSAEDTVPRLFEGPVCKICFEKNKCTKCGGFVWWSDPHYLEGSSELLCYQCYCEEAKKKGYEVCAHCAKLVASSQIKRVEFSSTPLCPNCYQALFRDITGTNWYHAMKDKSRYVLYDLLIPRTEVPLIGTEVEIQGRYDPCDGCPYYDDCDEEYCGSEDTEFGDNCRHRQNLYSILNQRKMQALCAVEEDGSLHNYGLELPFQPGSAKFYTETIGEKMRQFMANAYAEGFTGGTNEHCGMHMHIDRAFFEDKEESACAKLLYIFEKFKDELLIFSRREEDQVCDWCSGYDELPAEKYKGIMKKYNKRSMASRYRNVNLTNANTIEIRLWRSTLNFDVFKATIKFTERLAIVAKDTPAVKLCRMTWEDLLGTDPDILSYWEQVKSGRLVDL